MKQSKICPKDIVIVKIAMVGGQIIRVSEVIDIAKNEVPTAYDVDKVVEELEEMKTIKEMDLSFPQNFTKEQSDWIKSYCIKRNIEFYNKAIDDLIAKCENAKFAESDEIALSDIHTGVNSGLSMSIHLAEQLKAGGENA